MKTIKNLKKKDLLGKRVLVRVDFNVPLKAGKVAEDFRIEQSLPTIDFLRKNGAKLILLSHIGDDGSTSLAPVVKHLQKYFPAKLAKNLEDKKTLAGMENGDVVVLENIRRYEGEKKNDPVFCKQLASFGDIYVNEAFSVSHRSHASVVGVAKFLPSYAGIQLVKEVENLSRILKPKLPMVVILGGIKFQTKIPLIKKLQKNADKIFIGGALANTFFKAKGEEVGNSIVDKETDYLKPFLKNKKIILPVDKVFNKEKMIVDIGPSSIDLIKQIIKPAKTILWNGPMGWFEKGSHSGTDKVAKILAESKAFSVVGGGDTLASIKNLGLDKKFGFISTGGGAMLDFLASDGKLPGLKAFK